MWIRQNFCNSNVREHTIPHNHNSPQYQQDNYPVFFGDRYTTSCCSHFPLSVPEESPFLLHMFTFPFLGVVISVKNANLFSSGQFLFSNERMLPLQPLHA